MGDRPEDLERLRARLEKSIDEIDADIDQTERWLVRDGQPARVSNYLVDRYRVAQDLWYELGRTDELIERGRSFIGDQSDLAELQTQRDALVSRIRGIDGEIDEMAQAARHEDQRDRIVACIADRAHEQQALCCELGKVNARIEAASAAQRYDQKSHRPPCGRPREWFEPQRETAEGSSGRRREDDRELGAERGGEEQRERDRLRKR